MVEKELHFPQVDIETVEGPIATIKTNHGDLRIKLFPEHAPKTVANFVALSKDGYYDGVIFHRIIKDFMIQGGDQLELVWVASQSTANHLRMNSQKNFTIFVVPFLMANAGPNTNGSQFFIVQNQHLPYSKKKLLVVVGQNRLQKSIANQGGTPHLDRRHTVLVS